MVIASSTNELSFLLNEEQQRKINETILKASQKPDFTHGEKQALGNNLSVVFLHAEGSLAFENILEAHQKFYDLHCTIEGTDRIVVKPVSACTNIKKEYDAGADYILYNEIPTETFLTGKGKLCLLAPEDAHMALYGDCGLVKKIVFKIPVI